MKRNILKMQITQLTELWYELVGQDHHKDKDCHWYINVRWSYGNKPVYDVEHYGYVYQDVHSTCNTYVKALKELRHQLYLAFLHEKEWAERVMEKSVDWDSDQIERAQWIIDNWEKVEKQMGDGL